MSIPDTSPQTVTMVSQKVKTITNPGGVAGLAKRPVDAAILQAGKRIAETRSSAHPALFRRTKGLRVNISWFFLAWALLIGFWELGAYQGFLNPRILPPPSQTIPYLFQGAATASYGVQKVGILQSIGITILRIFFGLVLGLSSAMLAGALISEYSPLRRLFMPIVQTLAPISPVAWIPFAIASVGIGNPAAVFVVFMAIFGSMCLAAVAAFDGVPDEYIKVALSLGSSRKDIWFRVILPAAAPTLATMMRMSFFAAWMAVLAGEMAGINSGLGYLIIMGQQMYNMKLVMIGIIMIGLFGFLIDRLLLFAHSRIIWWENRG
jgi:ABC-type nitrate/sulfonate/bicarbonate transport system permease component